MRKFSVHAVVVLAMLLGCVAVALVGVSRAAAAEVPASVAADCSKDVTAALLAWIESVPDGSVLLFGRSACYRVDGTITLTNRHDLTIEGAGATFQHGTDGREAPEPRTRMMFNVQQGSNITIQHTIVRGANPHAGVSTAAYVEELEAQHAYNFNGTQGVLLDHVQAYDVYGDFVYFGRGDGQPVRHAVVRNSRFERNGRQGIAITSAEDVVIEKNMIAQVRRATFDLEPNGLKWVIRRVTVQDNDIGPGRLLFFANHGAAAPIEDISFISNRLTGKAMNGSIRSPTGSRRKNYTLELFPNKFIVRCKAFFWQK